MSNNQNQTPAPKTNKVLLGAIFGFSAILLAEKLSDSEERQKVKAFLGSALQFAGTVGAGVMPLLIAQISLISADAEVKEVEEEETKTEE